MGAKLTKAFEIAKQAGGMQATMRLAMKSGMSSDKAAAAPDSPENIQKILKPDEKEAPQNEPGWVQEILMGVDEGKRNDAAAKLAGYYLHLGMPVEAIEQNLVNWNERNSPPLEWKEIKQTINSIASREGREKLSGTLGDSTKIDTIDILKYPDGTVKYNVKLQGVDGYAQMDGQTLGTFMRFKWKFLDIIGYIPTNVKASIWEAAVNKALAEAGTVIVPEDETPLGAVSGAVQSLMANNAYDTDPDNLAHRIVLYKTTAIAKKIDPITQQIEPEWVLALQLPTVANMLRAENERMSRKAIGEFLRILGFINTRVRFIAGGKQTRCWIIPLRDWCRRYDHDYARIIRDLEEAC